MSKLEQINQYISKTGIPPKVADRYCLHQSEMKVLLGEMRTDPINALDAIFSFGLAKGYRAAKAEMKEAI